MYYNDYPTEPIGHGNPYYRCCSCKRSSLEINGKLDGHSESCEWRKKVLLTEENDWMKYLIKQLLDSLPQNKDWLDPNIEKELRKII